VEGLHRLRIVTRRLRASLRLFAPLLPAGVVAAGDDGLPWIGRAIGAVRDLDVLAAALIAQGRRLGPRPDEVLAPLTRVVADRRAQALAALGTQLDSPRVRRLLVRLHAVADGTPPSRGAVRLGDVAPTLLRPILRGVLRAGASVDVDAPATRLHRLRVRVKELRYACETMRPLGGESLDGVIRRLERLQDVLGAHQDCVTQAAWLRAVAGSMPLPADTLLAMGAIIDRLDRRARKQRRRFRKAWRRIDRPRTRRAVLEAREAPS
jgi:CHAD domain-containing protein